MIQTKKKYKIPRLEGWEEVFLPLVMKITGARQFVNYGGCDFENETFKSIVD